MLAQFTNLSLKKTIMKKILSALLCLSAGIGLYAQTTLTNAVDFNVTDLNGNQYNLFSLLSSGKYVCIDFFFTTCGPCQATVPYYKQTFQNYGCNQYDVFFVSIDNGDNDAQCAAFETTYLGGPAGYPVVSGTQGGGNAVVSAYGIGAFPTYILIAPDHSVIEQDMWPISSAASFTSYFTAHQLTQYPCATYIAEQASSSTINLFPNPASNTLNISSDIAAESYMIYDAAGRLAISNQLSQPAEQSSIDISSLSPGMYFIIVRNTDGTVFREKFNKE